MNKRLVWNFEIAVNDETAFPPLLHADKEELRWESRFFWPHDQLISLQGLNDSFLNLSHYQSKHRRDTYYLIPDYDFNLKLRRDEWLYKPLLDETGPLQGFGKKINLKHLSPNTLLPATPGITAAGMLDLLGNQPQSITIVKEALIYKFDSDPTIKLELSRLHTDFDVFFSACIEGRSASLVARISHHLLPGEQSCSYVQFLKQRIFHD